MRVVFRPPTPSDLDALAADLRPMDVLECALVSGLAPREALERCLDDAEGATVAEIEGRVVAFFGYTPASFLGDEGYPWMLCANGIERHARVVLTCAPRFLGEMQRVCQRLSNVVHAHNHSAIRFLKWCGFEFGETFLVKGEPFLHFTWTRQAQMAEAA